MYFFMFCFCNVICRIFEFHLVFGSVDVAWNCRYWTESKLSTDSKMLLFVLNMLLARSPLTSLMFRKKSRNR